MTGLIEHLLATPAWVALLVVFGVPALESSAFLGFVFPGEAAVLLGGVVASQGRLPLAGVLAAGIAGAVVGDTIGYLVGRRWGRRILDSTLGRFVRAEHLDRAERALARRGVWAVFLGRFTVALRVMVPSLAGMARMRYRHFTLANLAGGALWVTATALTGYLAGSSWRRIEHSASLVSGGITLALLLLLVSVHAARRRRSRHGIGRAGPPNDEIGQGTIAGTDGTARSSAGAATAGSPSSP